MTTSIAAIELDSLAAPIELERVSAVLSARDAEDLRWYFRSGGLAIFAQSPTAALIARLQMFGQTARPCLRCGGDTVKWNGGTGFVDSRTGRAPLTAEATRQSLDMVALLDIELPVALGDKLCPSCDGRGWAVPRWKTHSRAPITARPNGGSMPGKSTTGVDVDVTDLARLGHVTSWLDRIRARQGELPAAAVLEAYYSPDGGSLGSLWAFTPAGKKMLKTNPRDLYPREFFANEREAQSTNPNDKRRLLFKAAEEQAEETFTAACRVANEARQVKQ